MAWPASVRGGRTHRDRQQRSGERHPPTAVGKKNWLFISDAEAGERSAILFTVIDACSRRGIDPFEYHREVFTRTPTMVAKDYPGLAPEAWAKERTSAKPDSKASLTKLTSSLQRQCA